MSDALLQKGDLSGLPSTGLVVVGFSGGADSTALAHWLRGQIDPQRILLAHVNHLLRGQEAERDEAAARESARAMGLRFVVSRVDVRALALERGMGLEECGRAVRYRFFEELAPGEDDRILTAHNADDNAETVLLHLIRGAGLSGLCGIPPRRGKVLRPLLRVSREEIEAYCEEHDLNYVNDSSNFSDEFARNKVRHEIVPVLKELNPKVLDAVTNTTELLWDINSYVNLQGRELLDRAAAPYGLAAAALREAPTAVRRAALRLWLEEAGCTQPERKHLLAVEDCLARGGAAAVPGKLTVRCAQGVLSAERSTKAEAFSLPVSLPETSLRMELPDGRVLCLEKKSGPFPKCEQKIHNLDFKNALSCDIITTNLTVRTRLPGDRFSPAGEKGGVRPGKSLKQVFQELGMPPALRETAVLIECDGELVWCQGAGASRRAAAREDSPWAVTVRIEGERVEQNAGTQ